METTGRPLRAVGLGMMLVLLAAGVLTAAASFEEDFAGGTLRLDYYHSGTAGEERFSLDRAMVEGPWPGSRTRLLDPTGLGRYLVEMVDRETNRPLYSRGFASIYGEWETTAEAGDGIWRTFQEAVRLPEPRRPVQVRLRKRDPHGAFREVWSVEVDPGSRFTDRPPPPEREVVPLQETGPTWERVDLLLLGDGYPAQRRDAFLEDARRLVEELFAVEPFRSRRKDFNVRAIPSVAAHQGVSRPRADVFRRSPLGARYNTFDSERYVLTLNDRAWRDVAAAAPYDAVVILVDDRQYGGGGIFNLYATAATGSAFSPYLFVHEFGHSFAALGDEYYTSEVATGSSGGVLPEPWEPNLTSVADPERLKWRDLVAPGMPVPTPWGKEDFEARSREIQQRRRELRATGAPEEALEALFAEERDHFTRTLGAEPHAGEVGAFEGAGYQAHGLYRPQADCLMFTRDQVGLCAVCRRAVERIIDLHTR